MNDVLKENKVTIVGTLIKADVRDGIMLSGHNYVSVSALIGANINGIYNEFPVEFFSSDVTAAGQPNKLYNTYKTLPSLVQKRVNISGSLVENRYWSTKKESLGSSLKITGRWVKETTTAEADMAEFVLGGFIAKEYTERKNKAGEIYQYDISLGQANWKGDKMSLFTLNIHPTQVDVLNGIRTYKVGDTVRINGNLQFRVETQEVEDTNTAFGAPVIKTFVNRYNNAFIAGGTVPFGPDDGQYPKQLITELVAAYKADGVEVENRAKSRMTTASTGASATVVEKPSLFKESASLI